MILCQVFFFERTYWWKTELLLYTHICIYITTPLSSTEKEKMEMSGS
jgi:hypothetical protein